VDLLLGIGAKGVALIGMNQGLFFIMIGIWRGNKKLTFVQCSVGAYSVFGVQEPRRNSTFLSRLLVIHLLVVYGKRASH